MYIFLVMTFSLIVAAGMFLQQPMFGMPAKGERKKRMQQSPHYKNGSFRNLSPTPNFTNGANFFTVLRDFFRAHPNRMPPVPLPAVKPNFKSLSGNKNYLIWFGHSSIFLSLNGMNILIDPVFSSLIGPLNTGMKAFPGTDIIHPGELPEIDYLLITHDHWDHLDYETVIALKNKTKKVLTGLGTGAHLEYWGFPQQDIVEGDWEETLVTEKGLKISAWYARHFSGRGTKRNANLWLAFIIETPEMKIYHGADSGFDSHYQKAGEKFGSFDLAILENGQYNLNWQYIHMMPEEVIQAGEALGAKHILPVHWGKFALSHHPWDEPIRRLTRAATGKQVSLIIPKIGEVVALDAPEGKTREDWWDNI